MVRGRLAVIRDSPGRKNLSLQLGVDLLQLHVTLPKQQGCTHPIIVEPSLVLLIIHSSQLPVQLERPYLVKRRFLNLVFGGVVALKQPDAAPGPDKGEYDHSDGKKS